MSDPVTWAAVGMAAVSNMAAWLIIIRGIKRGKNNKEMIEAENPGTGKECYKRGVRIAVVETKQSGYEENIKEIKRDIKEIIKALK